MNIKDLFFDLVLCFATFVFMDLLPGSGLRFRVGVSDCCVVSFLIYIHEPVPRRNEGALYGRHSGVAVECLLGICEYMGLKIPGTVREK